MRIRLKAHKKMAMALLIALFLLLQGATGSSALAASQAATDEPISGKTTTTVPAGKVVPGQTTSTTPLPSKAPVREYQQVDKPPAKKLDIPEYDLAAKLHDTKVVNRSITTITGKHTLTILSFNLALKNNGTKPIEPGKQIPIRIELVNREDNTLIQQEVISAKNDGTAIDQRHWVVLSPRMEYGLKVGTIQYVKLMVDVDPDNTFQEANRHRGNNRCVASW
jgi:hypothetical protein